MEKLSNLVTKADFVGLQLKPTLNGTNRIKSFFGGFISIIAAVCILFGFGYFGLSMIAKDKPIMNVVQRMEQNAIVYMKDNPIYFIAYDGFGQMVHNDPGFKRAVKPEIQLYKVRPHPDKPFDLTIFRGKTKLCEKSDMTEKAYNEQRSKGRYPEIAMCADASSLVTSQGEKYEGDLYLQNRYAGITSDYIYFKFKLCNEQEDPGCSDYLKEIGRISILAYRLDYYVDQSDYEDPVKPNITQHGYSLTQTVTQSVQILTKINEIVTDSSMFLTNESTLTYYSALSPTISIRPYENQERLLLEFIASVEKIVTANQRRYLKIPELLANMGGFMKAALAIGNLLSYLYSDYIYCVAIKNIEFTHAENHYCRPSVGQSNLQIKTSIAQSNLQIKSTGTVKLKRKQSKIPSFTDYLGAFFKTTKSFERRSNFKYLELNYLISSFLTIKQLKETKQNNYVEQG